MRIDQKRLALEAEGATGKYLDWYLQIIETASALDGYAESHHILPKSIFPDYMSDQWNLVSISARRHFICHLLLWKMFEKAENKRNHFKMLRAVISMSMGNEWTKEARVQVFSKSKMYEKAREAFSEYQQNCNWYTDGKDTIRLHNEDTIPDGFERGRSNLDNSETMFANGFLSVYHEEKDVLRYIWPRELDRYLAEGYIISRRPHKESTKEKMSKARDGIVFTQEHKDNIARVQEDACYYCNPENDDWIRFLPNAHSNNVIPEGWVKGFPKVLSEQKKDKMSAKVWYTNGTESLRLSVADNIPEGWVKGRSDLTTTTGGRVTVNDGVVNKIIEKSELDFHLSNGWMKGMKPQIDRKKRSTESYKIGRIRMTNGTVNLNSDLDKVEEWIAKGYWKGMTKNLKKVVD